MLGVSRYQSYAFGELEKFLDKTRFKAANVLVYGEDIDVGAVVYSNCFSMLLHVSYRLLMAILLS